MNDALTCKECKQLLTADAPQGLCPACLMKLAAQDQTDAMNASVLRDADPTLDVPVVKPGVMKAEQLAALFPQLEIFQQIGSGGMGGCTRRARNSSTALWR